MSTIIDSGNRREFESGAVRDIQEGKGRCDLLPLREIAEFLNDEILRDLARFSFAAKNNGIMMSNFLYNALENFIDKNYSNKETAILELAKHYEDGCKKYGERNWEKGIPLHCFIDSAIRHYLKFLRGYDTDERHDRAFMWNIFGALWTLNNHPELNDMKNIEK